MKSINISFSLRAFLAYFIILGSLAWYIVGNALERLNDGMRQSAESVMVDVSHMLAAQIETTLQQQHYVLTTPITAKNIAPIAALFENIKQREIAAKIYQVSKKTTESDSYITDINGMVVYDSTGRDVGHDYSAWRDVRLTLKGEYGARTSFKNLNKTQENDEKIMVIAAPIKWQGAIIGVVSTTKSINSLEAHLKTESQNLKQYTILLVLLAIVISYLLSFWFTHSLEKISRYAKSMALGKVSQQPRFWDNRLDNLSTSVTNLRDQLDGKEYVEQYIHSLTHELKTPITSIRGAAELLLEDMPAAEQKKFIGNINVSNHRMAQLVDKMLSLAKLESQTELVNKEAFNLFDSVQKIVQERDALIQKKSLNIQLNIDKNLTSGGDRLLIRQAIANLIDNAIDFCVPEGLLEITAEHPMNTDGTTTRLTVFNQGQAIPDYALPRLYERFFSLPRKLSHGQDSVKSTGLGLSFVQEIMKLHKGSVRIKNTAKGATSGVLSQLDWQHT